MKATIVTRPTSTRVHGSAVPTRLATLCGKNVYDTPKSKCTTLFRYCRYWSQALPVGTPSWASIAALVEGLTGPFWASLAIAASAGEPGMSRGRRKFSVTAAHRVSRSRPALPSR